MCNVSNDKKPIFIEYILQNNFLKKSKNQSIVKKRHSNTGYFSTRGKLKNNNTLHWLEVEGKCPLCSSPGFAFGFKPYHIMYFIDLLNSR